MSAAAVGRCRIRDGDGELRSAGLDGPGQAVQHDLHAGQLGVDEVLRLVPQDARFLVGVIENALGHRVGLPHDLGALDHVLGLGPDLAQEGVGLAGTAPP